MNRMISFSEREEVKIPGNGQETRETWQGHEAHLHGSLVQVKGKTKRNIMKSISLKPPIWQEIKRARRMFKSMDCDNLRETSQKMIVDTFAPVAGGGASLDRGRGQQVDTSV